jgi:hypothetical protein
MSIPNNVPEKICEETRWTDARIRWPEDGKNEHDRNIDGTTTVADGNDDGNDDDNDNDDEGPLQDPFKDADPLQTFNFQFVVPRRKVDDERNENATCSSPSSSLPSTTTLVDIEIYGYKDDSDQVWESTGLTVWRAAKHLW